MTAGPDQARVGLARSGRTGGEQKESDGTSVLDLRGHVSALRRFWRSIVLCTVAGIGVAVVASLLAQPTYEADMTFFVASSADRSNTPLQADEFAQRRINSYVGVINSERLAEVIVPRFGSAAAYDRDHQDDLGVRGSRNGVVACHGHGHLGRSILDRRSIDCRKPRQAHWRT